MSRRRKPPSIPAPPEIAESAKAYEQFLAKLFPKGLKPKRAKQNNATLKYLARRDLGLPLPPKRGAKPPSGPKPGSAAAWIDEVCPNGEWRLMSAKAVEAAIAMEIDDRNKNTKGPRIKKKPSYSAVQKEIKQRKTQRAKT
jgi:hypothetical protein